jgi:hypothetical protein
MVILFFDNSEHFVLAHDEILLTVNFQFGAGVFAVINFVTCLEDHFFIFGALTGCDYCATEGFFFFRIGDDDT